jgi:hypothetical protein
VTVKQDRSIQLPSTFRQPIVLIDTFSALN